MKNLIKNAVSFGVLVTIPFVALSLTSAAMYKIGYGDGRYETTNLFDTTLEKIKSYLEEEEK